ncbi:cobalt ECF transporter T component CbiQ [Paenirhodobacter enshiensis]|uniref:cobalt ECF transporter T component CbiQ n=1 Tax=Paenirhodobacter enshiensis TaxID=1105367 RepID=UPI003FA1A848
MSDLRLRMIGALAVLMALSQLHRVEVALAALVVLLVGVAALRPGRDLWHRLLHVEGFVLILVLLLPLTVPGRPVAHVAGLPITAEGLVRAGLIACKVTSAALVLLAAFGRVEPIRLGAALHALGVPEALVRIFVLALRYLGLIRDEAGRLVDAMRLRGFRPGLNRHSWTSYGNLIGMLLLRALARAGRIEEAMRLRGFSGRFPHAALAPAVLRDKMALAALIAAALLLTLADRL